VAVTDEGVGNLIQDGVADFVLGVAEDVVLRELDAAWPASGGVAAHVRGVWHMVLGYDHIGCYIRDQNHSRELIHQSRECVFNMPTFDLIDDLIAVGNTHGPEGDKFAEFGLAPAKGKKVGAPLIAGCYANFECRLVDDSRVDGYSLFIFECVKAHVATSPRYPKTVHYRGDGVFMIAGENQSYRPKFKPEML
jgi:flavin reductase (DIM6/NTAB) family NADH-FMN oxidoreductase RutF